VLHVCPFSLFRCIQYLHHTYRSLTFQVPNLKLFSIPRIMLKPSIQVQVSLTFWYNQCWCLGVLSTQSTYKLESHFVSVVLSSLHATTLQTEGILLCSYMRMFHAVVTRDPVLWKTGNHKYYHKIMCTKSVLTDEMVRIIKWTVYSLIWKWMKQPVFTCIQNGPTYNITLYQNFFFQENNVLRMCLIFSAVMELNHIFQMTNKVKLNILYWRKCNKWFTQVFYSNTVSM
jgi:hypothetical protein